ncbi:hypothetical protein [Plantactinospora sp. CA-290183]|uniref:hypothetical protein n=1 Tax=Plantactinospora sp. CA-290183 TaxID=3240006 RepID=UPI003D91E816
MRDRSAGSRWIRRRGPVVGFAVAVAGLLAAVLLGFGALDPPPSGTDEPYYDSTAELEGSADLIVRATILTTRDHHEQGYPQTTARIAVARVAKGDLAEGARTEVAYGRPGSGPDAPEDLAAGREYVLLLATYPDSPSVLVNSTQGYYPVSEGRATAASADNPVPLSPETERALGLR